MAPEFESSQNKFNLDYPRILQLETKENMKFERVAAAMDALQCCLVVIGQLSTQQKSVLATRGIEVETHDSVSREELEKKIQQADLVMFASLYEGFGLPILGLCQLTKRGLISETLY